MTTSKLVYSTDGGGVEYCPNCGNRRTECTCRRVAASSRPSGRPATQGVGGDLPGDGIIRLHRDRKGRGGKTVTLVTGVLGGPATLQDIATTLKRHCGCGGGVNGNVIEIQGDVRERIASKLTEMGYKVKLAGG